MNLNRRACCRRKRRNDREHNAAKNRSATWVTLLPLSLAVILAVGCNSCSQPHRLIEDFAAAFNSSDPRALAPLVCSATGPQYSVEDASLLLRRMSASISTISEVIRVENLEDSRIASLVVARVTEPSGSVATIYFTTVPCAEGTALLASDDHRLVSGPYPPATNEERASLLAQISWYYSTNRLESAEALALGQSAHSLKPGDPNTTVVRAWAEFVAGDATSAYETFEALADQRGLVSQHYASYWDSIRDALADREVAFTFVDPPAQSTSSTVRLTVQSAEPAYFSLSGLPSGAQAVTSREFQVPLHVGRNKVSVVARPFRYAGKYSTQTAVIDFPKYIDNDDGTLTDTTTGLMWSREFITCREGSYSRLREIIQGLQLAGHSNWRLPTRAELLAVVSGNGMLDAVDSRFFRSKGAQRGERLRLLDGREIGFLATSEEIDRFTYWIYSFPRAELTYHYKGQGCSGLPVRNLE